MSDSTTPQAPVDIETIEAAKENIVPLHSGRSATQLASVLGAPSSATTTTTTTRSGLGVKLEREHERFRARIDAVDEYERTGTTSSSSLVSSEVVAQLAEDPLDVSHAYVRFIIANYPSGANASNRLVPVLEEATRRFVDDERYTNDPRYFRLWAQYAKHLDRPEECYRFLFARGIADKLAALYEEYAKVLEAAGKRKQADQVYLLGINRRATPLDRLKRSHVDFQARMLVAPPVPSPPPSRSGSRGGGDDASTTTGGGRQTVRPILSAATSIGGGGTGVGPKSNGSMFAVFKDSSTSAGPVEGGEAEWDDFGTIKSRKRENEVEKKEWAGETMPQASLPLVGPPGGGFKLEVYRDETATTVPHSSSLFDDHHAPHPSSALASEGTTAFARRSSSTTMRERSEAEQLRGNPFKNYLSSSEIDSLVSRDPLENLEVLAAAAASSSSSAASSRSISSSTACKVRKSSPSSSSSSSTMTGTGGDKKKVKTSSSSSSSKSRSTSSSTSSSSATTKSLSKKTTSSSSSTGGGQGQGQGQGGGAPPAAAAATPRPQQVSFNLDSLRVGKNSDEWISFEELRVSRTRTECVQRQVDEWNGWEWAKEWDREILETRRTTYKIDAGTGWPILHDDNGTALYDFVRPATGTVVVSSREDEPDDDEADEAKVSQGATTTTTTSGTTLGDSSCSVPSLSLEKEEEEEEEQTSSPESLSRPTRHGDAIRDGDGERTTTTSLGNDDEDDENAPTTTSRGDPPSPTINTKAANAFLDGLFAKTLDFTRVGGAGGGGGGHDDDDDDESDDDDDAFVDVAGMAAAGGGSQYSTQPLGGGTQASEVSSDGGNSLFVPFSQTRSMMGDDSSFFGNGHSQQEPPAPTTTTKTAYGQGLYALAEDEDDDEEEDDDENARARAPAPLQLFRDAGAGGGGGFRPVAKSTRAPLGSKPLVVATAAPESMTVPTEGSRQPAGFATAAPFSVFDDSAVALDARHERPSGQLGLEDHETPLRNDEEQEDDDDDDDDPARGPTDPSDGYAMGRRERGVPSRYAPFVDNMTPITERTLEITAAMNTHVLHLSSEQRRRSSRASTSIANGAGAYAVNTPGSFAEDDEPSTEEDEDEDDDDEFDHRDRAFVAVGGGGGGGEEIVHSNTNDDSTSSSSDDDDSTDGSQDSDSDDGVNDLSRAATLPRDEPFRTSPLPDTTNLGRSGDELAPIDPYDRALVRKYLSSLPCPIERHALVVDLSSHRADKLAGLEKMAKKRANAKGIAKDRTGVVDDAWDLELDGEVFSVREKLGEGSFGAVFRVAFAAGDDDDDNDNSRRDDESFDLEGTELFVAVKVERPANLWELYVLDQMQTRLELGLGGEYSARARRSILTPHRLYAYADESYLLLDLCDRGTLLNAVNRAQEYRVAPPGNATGLDELLAIFFTIELLRTIEAIHQAGVIHGDLKIDNCLLRFDDDDDDDDEGGGGAWQTAYDPTGANGWARKGLKVIDYGRSIDLTLFGGGDNNNDPSRRRGHEQQQQHGEQKFSCELETDQYDCIEMQTRTPWTFEPDYHGIASIAYCTLFGHYMETTTATATATTTTTMPTKGPIKRVPKQSFRRYHQVELWTRLFDMLLNPRDVRPDGSLPITNELADMRREMEQWLVHNCNKNGKSLKSLVSKLERCSLTK